MPVGAISRVFPVVFIAISLLSLLACQRPLAPIGPAAKTLPVGGVIVYEYRDTTQTIAYYSTQAQHITQINRQKIACKLVASLPEGGTQWQINLLEYQNITLNEQQRDTTDSARRQAESFRDRWLNTLLRHPIILQTDAAGNISAFEGFDPIWKRLGDSLPPAEKIMFREFSRQFGDVLLRDAMQEWWSCYPATDAAHKRHWNKILYFPGMGIQEKMHCARRSPYALQTKSQLSAQPEQADTWKIGGAGVRYSLHGHAQKKIAIHPTDGMMTAMEGHKYLSGNMEIGVPFRSTQKIPLEISVVARIRRVE